MEEQNKTKEEQKPESQPKFSKLMEIYVSPEGLVDIKGPLHAKPLCIDALATAIKLVIAFRPQEKRIISGGAMHRFARRVKGAFGGRR